MVYVKLVGWTHWNVRGRVGKASLGRRFKICEVSFKPYASCRHTHPAIEAALTLKAKYGLAVRDVVKVRVGTFSTALKIAGNPKPKTPFAAKFSIQYCVAAALVYGRVWLEEFSEQALRNPDVRRLMRKVDVYIDEEVEKQYPSKCGAKVEIKTGEGTYEFKIENPKGDPENPLTDEEFKAKFMNTATRTLGENQAEEVVYLIEKLEKLDNVNELAILLRT